MSNLTRSQGIASVKESKVVYSREDNIISQIIIYGRIQQSNNDLSTEHNEKENVLNQFIQSKLARNSNLPFNKPR